jgi:hypothetical protein
VAIAIGWQGVAQAHWHYITSAIRSQRTATIRTPISSAGSVGPWPSHIHEISKRKAHILVHLFGLTKEGSKQQILIAPSFLPAVSLLCLQVATSHRPSRSVDPSIYHTAGSRCSNPVADHSGGEAGLLHAYACQLLSALCCCNQRWGAQCARLVPVQLAPYCLAPRSATSHTHHGSPESIMLRPPVFVGLYLLAKT